MADPTADDELLAILLVNLRNAEATFGQGTPPCESIKTTVKEHLESMKANGLSTNITTTRQLQKEDQSAGAKSKPSTMQKPVAFGKLPFRPKSGGS